MIKVFITSVGVPWHLCGLQAHQRHGCHQDQGQHWGRDTRQVHQVFIKLFFVLWILGKYFLRVGLEASFAYQYRDPAKWSRFEKIRISLIWFDFRLSWIYSRNSTLRTSLPPSLLRHRVVYKTWSIIKLYLFCACPRLVTYSINVSAENRVFCSVH